MSHPNPTSKHILSHGIFEQPLIEWARQNYADPHKNFIDIGAHMGTYTINLAPHFKHTWAFEAQKNTYYGLAGGIALNDLSSRVTATHCALSNPEEADKMLQLKVISADGGGSSIKSFSDDEHQNILGTEKVLCKTLDSFEIEEVALIKIDVEGAELDVIQGARRTLENSNYPPILFEVWPDKWYEEDKHALLNYLNSLGYQTQCVYADNMYLATFN
jgi:FkbM family methyltransferase